MSPELIGLVLTLGSLGWLAGAFLAGRLSRRFGVGPTIVGASVLFGPAARCSSPSRRSPHADPRPRRSPPPRASREAPSTTSPALSLMQTLTPERLLGRLNASRALHRLGNDPARVAGRRRAGVVRSGLRPTLWVGAIGGSLLLPARRALARPLDRRACRRSREPDRTHQRAAAAGRAARCLSCPRSRRGCGSSTRSCPRTPIERAGPGARRDAEDHRPAALGARGPAARGRASAAAKNLALPDRGRRARAPRPPDERGPHPLPRRRARRGRRRRCSGSASRTAASSS